MKKTVISIFAIVALMCAVDADAQNWLKKLGKTVENAAKRTVERKVEQKTEQAVSNVMDGNINVGNSNSGNQWGGQQQVQQGEVYLEPEVDGGEAIQPVQQSQSLEMTYAKSDFVPGDEIIFEDNQEGEQLGEFPSQWDMDYGNAEIVQMGGDKAIMLIGYTAIMPLIGDGKNYFPEQFTVEFDAYFVNGYKDDSASDQFEIGFNDSRTLIVRFHCHSDNGGYLSTSWRKPNDDSGSARSSDNSVYFSYNKWHHVAISFNKRACKIYVDGVRVVNIPNMKQPTSMWMWSEEKHAYFKNFRIAKGAVPLYDRMMSEGKFITYGITFDVGKSTIKPESMGEINRIVQLMTENPELKFSVEGHTDNTGNPNSNQTLSEQRSQAIVDKLVEMGISADRLTAVGKGQNSPIADNTTEEGRAKNRRVEFVKQ